MSKPLLSISNFNLKVNQNTLLNDVSLEISPSEIMVLLGPSGCGKTTLLKSVCGFHSQWQGSIKLEGQALASVHQEILGMVFQNYALFPHMTVQENIAFGLGSLERHEKNKRTDWALELVDLQSARDKRPQSLSGGEQQRVALARSLAPKNVKLLLLDEPFANLDPSLAKKIRMEIKAILKSVGVACLMVTHDVEEAMVMADKLAVIHQSQIAQTDTPEKLYQTPIHPDVANFIGEPNFIRAIAKGNLAKSSLGDLKLIVHHEGEVNVLLWPNQLRFSDEGISAEIIETTFLGDRVKYKVEVEGMPFTLHALTKDQSNQAKVKLQISDSLHCWKY